MIHHPYRVRVIVLGAGLHGLGVVYDLLSRGWQDVVLLEKSAIYPENGRYDWEYESLFSLFNFRDFRHISAALNEWEWLSQQVHNAFEVKWACQLFLETQRKLDSILYATAMEMYRYFLQSSNLSKPRRFHEIEYPWLKWIKQKHLSYEFEDILVSVSVLRSRLLNAIKKHDLWLQDKISDLKIKPIKDGWEVQFRDSDQKSHKISSLYIVNALDIDANQFLSENRLPVYWRTLSVAKRFLLIDARQDIPQRLTVISRDNLRSWIRFLPLPQRRILLTFEHYVSSAYQASQMESPTWRSLKQEFASINFLNDLVLTKPIAQGITTQSVIYESPRNIRAAHMKSPFITSEHRSGRGLLLTPYHLKALTFRSVSEEIGNRISRHFGDPRPSMTKEIGIPFD